MPIWIFFIIGFKQKKKWVLIYLFEMVVNKMSHILLVYALVFREIWNMIYSNYGILANIADKCVDL